MGVDLSHSSHESGIGLLNTHTRTCRTQHVVSQEDILSKVKEEQTKALLIDAPLSFPPSGTPWRACERALIKMNAHPLPLTLPSMQVLAKRGMKLKNAAKKVVPYIFETFPAASFHILGFKKKPKTKLERTKAVRKLVEKYAITVERELLSKDELDAFMCCLAGFCWMLGDYTQVKAENCCIILVGKPRVKSL